MALYKHFQAWILIFCIFSMALSQAFTVFNLTNNTYDLSMKDPEGNIVAFLKVASHVPEKVSGFEGKGYDQLYIAYQQESSWLQSILQPLSFLIGTEQSLHKSKMEKLKPAPWEQDQTITKTYNLMLTDTGPILIGSLPCKALMLKAYAIKTRKEKA